MTFPRPTPSSRVLSTDLPREHLPLSSSLVVYHYCSEKSSSLESFDSFSNYCSHYGYCSHHLFSVVITLFLRQAYAIGTTFLQRAWRKPATAMTLFLQWAYVIGTMSLQWAQHHLPSIAPCVAFYYSAPFLSSIVPPIVGVLTWPTSIPSWFLVTS